MLACLTARQLYACSHPYCFSIQNKCIQTQTSRAASPLSQNVIELCCYGSWHVRQNVTVKGHTQVLWDLHSRQYLESHQFQQWA